MKNLKITTELSVNSKMYFEGILCHGLIYISPSNIFVKSLFTKIGEKYSGHCDCSRHEMVNVRRAPRRSVLTFRLST